MADADFRDRKMKHNNAHGPRQGYGGLGRCLGGLWMRGRCEMVQTTNKTPFFTFTHRFLKKVKGLKKVTPVNVSCSSVFPAYLEALNPGTK